MNRADPRADARANRGRVLAAARDLFSERGTGAEVRDIAERAGVAVGTIYRNYPTKGDLVAAILADVIAEGRANAEAAEALSDPVAGLASLLENIIIGASRYGWLSEAILGGQFQELVGEGSAARSYKADLVAAFNRLIQAAATAGSIRRDIDPEVAAVLLASVTLPHVLRPLLETRTQQEVAAAILGCILGAVGPPLETSSV